MGKIKNFRLHGYQIAKGTKGTRWMAFTESNAKEVLAEGKWLSYSEMIADENYYLEVLDEYVEGWKETNQWEYEVGSNMSDVIVDGEVNDTRQDEEMNWFGGYGTYAQMVIKKLVKKEKKK